MNRQDDPLVITPLMEENQIQPASVDVRLGKEFIAFSRSSLECIDTSDTKAPWETRLHEVQTRIRKSWGQRLVLHPGELILGATLEYLSIPKRMSASVEGKSSWGRLGLFIATATAVCPGYKGCLTLEIINSGEVPIIVYPGYKIAQILLFETSDRVAYSGKYNCAIGPEFSKAPMDNSERCWTNANR